MVATDPDAGSVCAADYVSVDWGPDFARDFVMAFPEAANPGLTVNLGPLALNYVLAAGGSGYFRMSAVQPHLSSGRLHLVPKVPYFSYPIYAVYSAGSNDSILSAALAGLRDISAA